MFRPLLALAILLGMLAGCGQPEQADARPAWFRPDPGTFPGPDRIDPSGGFLDDLA